ncbi:unnamed protein product [Vitrella brassicaformis CCMP3155]|uniref:Uncharacterized protein n=1 Tax=Vitrella brassicaformis (strain CCMP3155) TaxID=1169540 RepID=A0A0G4F4E0_VITBC|nr:unnamed protein product [Vitrella brassicaformis CCMP3155]|mmetsp:Transcript_46911/g.116928  ORF Transcript_46911/g.116928 Transcript_46911/m.116928 type:complete len:419 (-) Transcript_46911:178-1434(-)|eukprot:CEM06743.1 unnamed protein product [Vitrella brassicaformis CCMP3155]
MMLSWLRASLQVVLVVCLSHRHVCVWAASREGHEQRAPQQQLSSVVKHRHGGFRSPLKRTSPDEPRLHVVMVATLDGDTDVHTHWAFVCRNSFATAAANSIALEVIGSDDIDCEARGINRTAGNVKILLPQSYLQGLPDDDLILMADAWDVWFQFNETQIKELYATAVNSSGLIVSTETLCAPKQLQQQTDVCRLMPPNPRETRSVAISHDGNLTSMLSSLAESPFGNRFINAGLHLGRIGAFREYMAYKQQLLDTGAGKETFLGSDQAMSYFIFLNDETRERFGLRLDYDSRLSLTANTPLVHRHLHYHPHPHRHNASHPSFSLPLSEAFMSSTDPSAIRKRAKELLSASGGGRVVVEWPDAHYVSVPAVVHFPGQTWPKGWNDIGPPSFAQWTDERLQGTLYYDGVERRYADFCAK